MDNESRKSLKQENQQWHQEHKQWLDEVNQWQHETERLVGMLYKLEKALPDHSSVLQHHAEIIQAHEKKVVGYECGLDENCIASCPDYKSPELQHQFHQELANLHAEAKQQHDKIKQAYIDEMEKFRALVLALLEQVDI